MPRPTVAKPRNPAVSVPPLDPMRYAPSAARPLRVKSRRLSADTQVEPHSHAWAQVAFSVTGVTRVTAGRSTFIVPPSRAVWIPPRTVHTVAVVEDADMRTLYLHQPAGRCGPDVPPGQEAPWQGCRVLEVSPLLRELVLQMAESQADDPADVLRERCIATLVLDELRRARPVPLGVDLPQDKRLRALCEAVLHDPARHATLDDWARDSGASPRTVARLFRQELNTSFAQWRQQVVLAKAVALAARKRPMSLIAAELGYASASAFTAMVRRSVGMPPSRFFASAQAPNR